MFDTVCVRADGMCVVCVCDLFACVVYICICACARVCVYVRENMYVRHCACMRVCVCVCVYTGYRTDAEIRRELGQTT